MVDDWLVIKEGGGSSVAPVKFPAFRLSEDGKLGRWLLGLREKAVVLAVVVVVLMVVDVEVVDEGEEGEMAISWH